MVSSSFTVTNQSEGKKKERVCVKRSQKQKHVARAIEISAVPHTTWKRELRRNADLVMENNGVSISVGHVIIHRDAI